jgi:hypothetical protein
MQCPIQSYTQIILLALLLTLSSCNRNAPQANNEQEVVRQQDIALDELQRLYDVEKRIKAFALMGGGPKLTHWLRTMQDPRVARLREEGKLNAYINLMASIDPDGYIRHAAPATILFQNGRYDENVTQARAAQYHEAASDPKEVKWYNAGHSLNEEARRDRTEWLIRTLDVK